MKYMYLLITMLLVPTFAQASELIEHTALDGKVTLITPKSFAPMSKHVMEDVFRLL